MDQNKGETPNPLNPAVTPKPAPTPASAPAPTTPTTPVEQTPSPAAPDPLARPMQQAEPATQSAAKTTKKKWPIIAIIVCLFLAVGCGVAAILLNLNANKGDAVAAAVAKLMSGETPNYVAVDGNINFKINDEDSYFSAIDVNLKSDLMPSSLINSSSADVTLTTTSGTTTNIEVNEVYASNGDLYLKVDNATDAVQTIVNNLYNSTDIELEDCEADDDADDCLVETIDTADTDEVVDTTEEMYNPYTEMLEPIDGEWLKISVDEMKSMAEESASNESTKCLVEFASNIKNDSNTIAGLYNNAPFISSTTENIPIASKKFPVYLVKFDSEKLAAFTNSLAQTNAIKNFTSCMNNDTTDSEISVDTETISELIGQLPNLYVEVDNDNNFTRLYATTAIEDMATMTIDLNLSYPANVNVSEPTEYSNFSDVIQNLFNGSSFYYETSVNDIEE